MDPKEKAKLKRKFRNERKNSEKKIVFESPINSDEGACYMEWIIL